MESEQAAELARWRLADFAPDKSYMAQYHSRSRFLAIGGCGRSGTTLLRRMLGAAQQIVDGPESYLLLPVALNTCELEERYALQPRSLSGLETANRWSFVDAFQQIVTRERNGKYWLDKTSRNVHCFTHIAKRFPHAAFIHVVRDPRDVVLSLRTHPQISRTWSDTRATDWKQPWRACIDRWELAVTDATRAVRSVDLRTVRYEDLIHEPRNTIQVLCASLGIEFDENMLRPERRQAHPSEARYMPNNQRALGALVAGRIGRWKTGLPDEIRKEIEKRLKLQMARYAYEPRPR